MFCALMQIDPQPDRRLLTLMQNRFITHLPAMTGCIMPDSGLRE